MDDVAPVRTALTSRRSVRGYLDDPVPRGVVEDILLAAGRAPSGTNIQPWRVWVLEGAAKDALVDLVTAEFDAGRTEGLGDYYPSEFVEPYLSRRRKVGWDLYGLLGIQRGEWDKSRAYHRRNFEFFGAPVGLVFAMHETMRSGGWMDLGLYMQGVMTMARAHGLHTCPQAAWLEYKDLVGAHLGLPEGYHVVAGMSLGYEDPDAEINRLFTERVPLEEFVTFVGEG